MDVYKWLNDTIYGAAPESPQHQGPQTTRQGTDLLIQPAQKQRWKRARAGRSSSIVVLDKSHRNEGRGRNKRLSYSSHGLENNVRHGWSSPLRSQTRQSALTPAQTRPPQATRPYERRARHKTKADKYEPKATKAKRRNGGHEEARQESKRRERQRNADGTRTTGLVQSFQLKNGPKAGRLTLRPDSSAGLFKHGRASAQLNGCGRGLPDLVFNEMKFLKQPHEHQDEAVRPAQSPEKKRARRPEEETCAYFDEYRKPTQQSLPATQEGQEAQVGDTTTMAADGQIVHEHRSPRVLHAAHLYHGTSLRNNSQSHAHKPLSKDDNATTYFTWSKSSQSKHSDAKVQLVRSSSQVTRVRPVSSSSVRVNVGLNNELGASRPVACLRSARATGQSNRQESIYHGDSEFLNDPSGMRKEFTSQSLPHLDQYRLPGLSSHHPNSHLHEHGWITSDILNVKDMFAVNGAPRDDQKLKSADSDEPSSWTKHFWRAQGAMQEYAPVLDKECRNEGRHTLQMADDGFGVLGKDGNHDGDTTHGSQNPNTATAGPPRLREWHLQPFQACQQRDRGEPSGTYGTEADEPRIRSYDPSSRAGTLFSLGNAATLLQPDLVGPQYDYAVSNAIAEPYEDHWTEYGLHDASDRMQSQDGEGISASLTYSASQQPTLYDVQDIGTVRGGRSIDPRSGGDLFSNTKKDLNVITAPYVDDVEELDSFWRPQKLW